MHDIAARQRFTKTMLSDRLKCLGVVKVDGKAQSPQHQFAVVLLHIGFENTKALKHLHIRGGQLAADCRR